jgi:HAMP domain-containing protein
MKLFKAAGLVLMFIDGAISAAMGRQFVEDQQKLKPLRSFRPAYGIISKLPEPLFRIGALAQAVMAIVLLMKLRNEAE